MGRSLAEILPLALAATVSPGGLLFVMMILSGKGNARRNSLMFLLGGSFFLIVLGTVVTATYKPAVSSAGNPGRLAGVIDIVLALLIAVIIIRSMLTGKSPKQPQEENPGPRRQRPYPVLGFVFMLINISTLIPFIAAVKLLADDRLGVIENMPMFAILVAVTMFMIAFPVIISYLVPDRSQKVLGPVESFMSRHGQQIAHAYFLAIAAYLAVKGLITLSGA